MKMLDGEQSRSHNRGMKKLLLAKRAQILSMLCRGSAMRSISRVADVSINTVFKLLADAGEACDLFHDAAIGNVRSQRIQCDEAWSFCSMPRQKTSRRPKPLRPMPATFGHGPLWIPIPS